MHQLSVVIIAFNEAKNIRRCLASVGSIADEIVVIDSESTDETPEICREAQCRVISRKFDGYGTQKQFAVNQASNDWILSIDADEVVTSKLASEITKLKAQAEIPEVGFTMCFSLIYMGKKLRHGGAGNDYHLRLFNRNFGGFTDARVHEGIELKGKIGRLNGEVLHYSYRDLAHHLEKLNFYTSRAAETYLRKGKKYSKLWAVCKFPISFLQFYCCKLGFLDGYPGFMWSFLGAFYATLKIAKSIEMRETDHA